MKYLFIVITSLLLSGCWWNAKPDVPPLGQPVQIDARALEECMLEKALPDTATFADVLDNVAENTQRYYDCRQKQHNSIQIIKKLSDIK